MASTTSQMASRATHAARGGVVGRFYRKRFPYILALPILLYEGFFLLYPMARGALLSFSDVQMGSGGNWVGLDNYRRMFGDAIFWQVILNTIVFSASVIVIALLVGLGIALLMNRSFYGRATVRAVMTMPWAFPDVPTVLIFLWIMNPVFGVLDVFARWAPWVHSNPGWFIDPHLAMPSIVMLTVWKGFPFYSLVILAALQGVPADLYEAARVDGANWRASFRYVTLPGIMPSLMLLGLLAFVFSFQQFTLIWLTTGGGPVQATETLAVMIYQEAFRFFDYSYAATLGVAGLALSMAAAALFIALERRASTLAA